MEAKHPQDLQLSMQVCPFFLDLTLASHVDPSDIQIEQGRWLRH
jgi:hypothetical protein